MFAHGFGCDQTMWRQITPAFENEYRIVLFDHAGSGRSDVSEFDEKRHSTLHGYARDVLDIIEELDLHEVRFVGHSVSSMIGALAAIKRPERFESLVMIGPSPCYLNDGTYVGGFDRPAIESLLDDLEKSHVIWSATMAPLMMGTGANPFLVAEFEACLCRMDPKLAHRFAKVIFFSDHRADLPRVPVRTLVLQCEGDVVVPSTVGRYMQQNLPDCKLVRMPEATGHCPHMHSPKEVIRELRNFLDAAADEAENGSREVPRYLVPQALFL